MSLDRLFWNHSGKYHKSFLHPPLTRLLIWSLLDIEAVSKRSQAQVHYRPGFRPIGMFAHDENQEQAIQSVLCTANIDIEILVACLCPAVY